MTLITLENKEEPTRYSNMKTIVIDNDDAEDQEMKANKVHLIQKYEESLQSWYGLTI